MSDPTNPQHQFLMQVLAQNGHAVAFCETVFGISQTLDDIVDGDRAIAGTEVIQAFWDAMIELPANPFYRANETYLRPLLAQSLQDWTDSTVLERARSQHDATLAFVLRDQLTGLVIQCAYLVAGQQWMRQIGPVIRRYFHDEPLTDYLGGLQPGEKPRLRLVDGKWSPSGQRSAA